ncbi:porin [Chromohalobacter nigrandesensis]|uniref:porin n=1 Tax=Chromohalobacter nigrandesensis TaxID=119863 RepID=UPI001FF25EB7|nr:porin [Chromohalobacter nigrandesensis]MCK0745556.1 porin [Chromohalobacter nigrandesensis]
MNNNRKLTGLAIAIAAALTTQQAIAATLYETTRDKLTLSGRIAAGSSFVDEVDDDHDPVNAGSRVRLIHEHNFQGGWSSVARAEWGFDPFFEDGTDAHYKRMLYAGVSHDDYGTLLVGKQYSLWYDMVAYWTDWFWYNGATAQGSFNGAAGDGGFEGNGRPDNAATYKNTFGDWTVGVLYQTSRDDVPTNAGYTGNLEGYERDYTGQGAVVYKPSDDWSFGATYTHSAIDGKTAGDGKTSENVDAGLLAARWTPGNWYFALSGGEYHNLVRGSSFTGTDEADGIIDEARGYEGVALYNVKHQVPGTVQLYTGFNRLEDSNSDARDAFYLAGAAWLTLDDNLIIALERKFDDSVEADGSSNLGNDETDLLVRYNF